MKRLIVSLMVLAAMTCGLAGVVLAGSGAGAINLSFPIGARYNALGESGTALSQDATSMWWNNGGLAFLSRTPQIHVMQSTLVPDLVSSVEINGEMVEDSIALYWVGYAQPLGKYGAVGVSMNYLSMGIQQATDENGQYLGTFKSYMFAVSANYGVRLSRNLGVGIGVKYFRDKLADEGVMQDSHGGGSGDSFGVDMGVLWKVPAIKSNFGLSVANLGPGIKHVDADQSDPMPRKVTFGIATSLVHTEYMGLLVVADYLIPLYKWDSTNNDYGFGLATDMAEYGGGVEWNYVNSLFIRLGYKSADYGQINDITYGFGVDMDEWTGLALTFDFASVPQAEGLDTVKRLSVGYRF